MKLVLGNLYTNKTSVRMILPNNWLKYNRMCGKNLELDTYRVKQSLWPNTLRLRGQYQIWPLKLMLVFFFVTHLSSYNNIFKTETWSFFGVIRTSFGASIQTLNIWGCEYSTATDSVIARYITVSFCVFSQPKYARVLQGKIRPFTQHYAGVLTKAWPLKAMLVFVFHEAFKWLWYHIGNWSMILYR